jgi:GR25 family glycosyltransferase involved in LPS biosynthesis
MSTLNSIALLKIKLNFILICCLAKIGCYASRISIWQKIVSEQLEWALILEDDAIIDAHINEDLKLLEASLNFVN